MKAEFIYVEDKNRIYFFYDTGRIVGYDQGEPTTWIRSELSRKGPPEFHGHPMSIKRVDSYKNKWIRRSELLKGGTK